MTDTQIKTDPAAEHDPAVSQAYRDIATERTPEHLDRAVLAAAAQATRPAYSRLRFWTRPAAWAAVVMLSVALILETGQTPVPGPLPPAAEDVASDAVPGARPDREAGDADSGAAADVAERKAEAPARKSEFSANEVSPTDARELRVRDEAIMERAEETDRLRQGRDAVAEPVAEQFFPAAPQESAAKAARFAVSEEEAPPACDEDARAEPEKWLGCILELEDAGFLDAARVEREELVAAFPDFVPR